MSRYKIIREDGVEKEFDDEGEFNDMCSLLDDGDMSYETKEPDSRTDGGDRPEGDSSDGQPDTRETGATPDMAALADNPIDWLRGINAAYVNTISNTPAISKRGFRYIQSQFGITTRSEIVKWVDEPLGVVIWAKAELPDGRSAEAHVEAYQFESGIDDNEFVRYSDTRAKSRALADLTSSGALCVEEMQGGSGD